MTPDDLTATDEALVCARCGNLGAYRRPTQFASLWMVGVICVWFLVRMRRTLALNAIWAIILGSGACALLIGTLLWKRNHGSIACTNCRSTTLHRLDSEEGQRILASDTRERWESGLFRRRLRDLLIGVLLIAIGVPTILYLCYIPPR